MHWMASTITNLIIPKCNRVCSMQSTSPSSCEWANGILESRIDNSPQNVCVLHSIVVVQKKNMNIRNFFYSCTDLLLFTIQMFKMACFSPECLKDHTCSALLCMHNQHTDSMFLWTKVFTYGWQRMCVWSADIMCSVPCIWVW